jgi:hypothetical protein
VRQEGHGALPHTPPRNFLQKVSWNFKNFQKIGYNSFSISFWESKTLFSKRVLVAEG